MDRSQLEKIIPVLAERHNFRLEIVEKDYYLLNYCDHTTNEINNL